MGKPLADHGYDSSQPMADSGDLLTDLLNTGKDVGTIGGVETGDYDAVNSPDGFLDDGFGDRR